VTAEIVRRLAFDGGAVAFTYGTSTSAAEDLVAAVKARGATAVAIKVDSSDSERVGASVDRAAAELGGSDT
jgi:3-oxoacyl-[acyl-carrier protein] reductase